MLWIMVNGMRLEANSLNHSPIGLLAQYCWDNFGRSPTDCLIWVNGTQIEPKMLGLIGWHSDIIAGMPSAHKEE